MNSPPGNANAPLAKGRRGNLIAPRAYHFAPILQARCFVRVLRILQQPFAWAFWLIEQRIAKIDVEIERRRS
jgi:hypothetical protein